MQYNKEILILLHARILSFTCESDLLPTDGGCPPTLTPWLWACGGYRLVK